MQLCIIFHLHKVLNVLEYERMDSGGCLDTEYNGGPWEWRAVTLSKCKQRQTSRPGNYSYQAPYTRAAGYCASVVGCMQSC